MRSLPHWAFATLSVILYLVSCAAPALVTTDLYSRPIEGPVFGFQCLFYGLSGAMLLWPPLAWAVNPCVWVLWINAFRGRETKPWSAATVPVYAVFATWMACAMGGYAPQIGAALWIVSALLAAYASWRASP